MKRSAHEASSWLADLADVIPPGLEVRFHPSMPAESQRLMAKLQVKVIFDERVPPGTYARSEAAEAPK